MLNDATTIDLAGSDQKGIEATREIIELAEKTWDKVSKVFWEKDATKKVPPPLSVLA